MLRSTVLLIVCCTVPSLARADGPMCRDGMFPAESAVLTLAKVTGAPRTYLRTDTAPCPDDGAACRGRAYLVPGDTVLTWPARVPYVCALFPGKGGRSSGYVRSDEIAAQPTPAPALAAWAGRWVSGDDSIALRVQGVQLTASGEAYWPSAHPSLKDRPGGPNLGDMTGTAAPRGNSVVFEGAHPDDCRVKLTLLPPYLLASDNDNCGGHNVSFTGVYQRK